MNRVGLLCQKLPKDYNRTQQGCLFLTLSGNFHFPDPEPLFLPHPTVGPVAVTYTAGLPDLSLFLGYLSLFRFMVLPSYFIDPISIAIKKGKQTNKSLLFKYKSSQLLNKHTAMLSAVYTINIKTIKNTTVWTLWSLYWSQVPEVKTAG